MMTRMETRLGNSAAAGQNVAKSHKLFCFRSVRASVLQLVSRRQVCTFVERVYEKTLECRCRSGGFFPRCPLNREGHASEHEL